MHGARQNCCERRLDPGRWLVPQSPVPTNPANTSAIMHAQRLLVCCEGGPPIEVDPITLHTRGEHLFGEGLPMGFSAHAKIDEEDGCLCAFPSFAPLLNLKS